MWLILPFLLMLLLPQTLVVGFSATSSKISASCETRDDSVDFHNVPADSLMVTDRRSILQGCFLAASATTCGVASAFLSPLPSNAYTPDPDPLKESLYLISRVQEATCLQERYINKKLPPIQKMKLTLRLVDRSYRLLDQVNYISKFLDTSSVVEAVQAGNEAADSLQEAIDFVYGYKAKDGEPMTMDQKDFLIAALTNTREKLFEFVAYLPDQSKLQDARKRVEEENKLNVDEFDPDLANDAGIYNPVELPWKNRK